MEFDFTKIFGVLPHNFCEDKFFADVFNGIVIVSSKYQFSAGFINKMYKYDVWMFKNTIELNFKTFSVHTPDIVHQRIDLGFFQPVKHLNNMFSFEMISVIELDTGNNYTDQSGNNKNENDNFCKEGIMAMDCYWHGIPML